MQAKISKREISDKDLKCIFHAVDTDQSGEVDLKEFSVWVNREMGEVKRPSSPQNEERLLQDMQARSPGIITACTTRVGRFLTRVCRRLGVSSPLMVFVTLSNAAPHGCRAG